jgi:hypothetical protein
MPEAEDGFVKTLNNTGYMTVDLDRYSRAFVDFSGHQQLPVMDRRCRLWGGDAEGAAGGRNGGRQ